LKDIGQQNVKWATLYKRSDKEAQTHRAFIKLDLTLKDVSDQPEAFDLSTQNCIILHKHSVHLGAKSYALLVTDVTE
jgi:hypothetical protein